MHRSALTTEQNTVRSPTVRKISEANDERRTWALYNLWPLSRVRLLDRTWSARGATVMRCRASDGSWLYRALTEAELEELWISRQF